jgi:hypothetical protein
MSTITTATIGASRTSSRSAGSLLRTTVAVGIVAAATTTAAAAVGHAAGVPLAVRDGDIPLAGFAQITFLSAVVGGVIAAALNRLSSTPRRRFMQTAVALTALSCVAPIALAPAVAAKVALVATHLIAAGTVVPVLARRVND